MLSGVEALLALRDEIGRRARGEEPGTAEGPGPLVSFPANPAEWAAALMWIVAEGLGRLEGPERSRQRARARFESWHLGSLLTEVIEALEADRSTARRTTSAIEITLATDGDSHLQGDPGHFAPILEDRAGSRAAGINAYDGFDWLHRESFESLVRLMAATASVRAVVNEPESAREKVAGFLAASRDLVADAESAGYRVDVFLGAPDDNPRPGAPES
jgi:hypothetical protein